MPIPKYENVYDILKDVRVNFLNYHFNRANRDSFVCLIDVFERCLLSLDAKLSNDYGEARVIDTNKLVSLNVACDTNLYVIFDWKEVSGFYDWRCRGTLYETEKAAKKALESDNG